MLGVVLDDESDATYTGDATKRIPGGAFRGTHVSQLARFDPPYVVARLSGQLTNCMRKARIV